ncbi:MAG: error-prone DNA polymerase [Myxococcales bacterium]|nr:error-prone DNA polymerase [Myxococcales bacterium]
MKGYLELRCQSAFSFLRAASHPEDLAEAAAELEMPALALCDRDGLYGVVRFAQAARERGVRPLIGAEVALVEGGRLALLIRDAAGYRNLCRLLTAGHRGRPKGQCRVTLEEVERHAPGLLCLAAAAVDTTGEAETARRLLSRLQSAFGAGNLYLEVARHLAPGEERRNERLLALAESAHVEALATNDVRHAHARDRRLLDVFTCLAEGVALDRAGRRLLPNAERHLKSGAEMARLFSDRPALLDAARRAGERLQFSLEEPGYRFPEFPLPPGETAFSYLHRLVQQGARWRYRPLAVQHMQQLSHELALIAKLDLSGYFLVVWDICRFCRERGILVQGRGSAANSAVCYVLGITAVDPVGMKLLFERFLSEERGEWPDIDLDLPSGEAREEVIQYVYRRYGPHGAAMTANVITFRERGAVREIGKVLGLPAERLSEMSELLSGRDLPAEEAARQAGLDIAERRTRLLLELLPDIDKLPRHLGQHSGGMVLAAGRLDEMVPLEPAAMPGRTVVQWDKDDCARMGMIKVDLLGLGMLRALAEAVPLVRASEGVELDLARLPADDPAVYAMLRRADTVGVFQVESRAQMATLPRMKPRCFYDLVVEVALIRPGPLSGKMVHPYLKRRAGEEPVRYPHPSLEPVLARTLGVPIFQEQVMRMAMIAAGFSLRQVAELNRAMKRRSGRWLEEQVRLLFAGMAERGITGEAAEEIARGITMFLGRYGFPESHAASFALIAYASAYLKAHHPAAFACALLNAWPMGFYHPATLVQDARRHGVQVRPIDVGYSRWECRLEPDLGLRLGLRFVRGLRREAAERLFRERERRPFADLSDLTRRTGLRADELDTLAQAGACASLGLRRRQALWQASALAARAERPLLARLPLPAGKSPLREMGPAERSAADLEHTGLTAGPHPLSRLRPALRREGARPLASLSSLEDGARVRIAGMVITRQRPPSAKGMCFLTLEDESGIGNVVIAPPVFERFRAEVCAAPALMVEGRLERQREVLNVRAESCRALVPATGRHTARNFR